jgi:hypothetical protein
MKDGAGAGSRTRRGSANTIVECAIRISIVREIKRRLNVDRIKVRFHASIISFRASRIERRKYDGREDSYDGNDNEQFDESETS